MKDKNVKYVYYTNGLITKKLLQTDPIPDGFYKGRLKKPLSEEKRKQFNEKRKKTNLERYGDENYNNMSKNKQTKISNHGSATYNNREKAKQTCLIKYGESNQSKNATVRLKISEALKGHQQSVETKNKISLKNKGKKLDPKTLSIRLQKEYMTKKNNKSFKSSKQEDIYYQYLLTIYDENDIIKQYRDNSRYPFNCDFYIKSEDLFIELNLHWTHGYMPYNSDDEKCQQQLKLWQEKAEAGSQFYKNAIYTWTDLDVRKLEIAKRNKLNYSAIYNINNK